MYSSQSKYRWAILSLSLLLWGCPRGPQLPKQAHIGGLLAYDYSGVSVLHQQVDRDYIHLRLHFGWQLPEESSYATQNLAVEAAFTCGAGDFDSKALARKWESVGATLAFLTTADGPVILVDCLPDRIAPTWALIDACLTDPLFEKASFVQLRNRHVAAQKAAEADRSLQAHAAALKAAWPQTIPPLLSTTSQELEGVALATTQATFRDLMRQRCNLRLITVGPIEAERISDLLLETVDALPDAPCAQTAPADVAPEIGRASLVHETRGAQTLAGIFPGPSAASATTVQMQLVMQMLEKRLRDKLVISDKVATRLEASYIAHPQGYNLIQITGPNAFQCAEFTLSELRKLKTYGFSEPEVLAAQNAMRTQILLGYESASSLAAKLDFAASSLALSRAGNEILLLDAVTAKSSSAMLRQYLTGMDWGIVGDTTAVDRKSLQRL